MMSSFSEQGGGRGLLVLALAMAAHGGCAPAPTVDPAIFVRPMNTRFDCTGPQGQPIPDTVTMDTYIIQTFDVSPTFDRARSTDANSSDCQTCIGDGLCTIEHPQVCVCSGSVTATADNLTPELTKTRIPSLDTNDVYCFRVLAVDNGTVGTFPPDLCSCNPDWVVPSFLMTKARLCALSAPAAVGPLDIRLDLKCPGDRPTGGGGGQNNNSSPFTDCVNPPMM